MAFRLYDLTELRRSKSPPDGQVARLRSEPTRGLKRTLDITNTILRQPEVPDVVQNLVVYLLSIIHVCSPGKHGQACLNRAVGGTRPHSTLQVC